MSIVTHRIGDQIIGQGSTKTAARKQADELALASLQGTYRPIVIRADGHTMFGWREPGGANFWSYMIIYPDAGAGVITRYGQSSMAGTTREKVEDAMLVHLADILATLDSAPPEWLPEVHHAEYHRRQAWQLSYARLRAAGATDTEAHYAACCG